MRFANISAIYDVLMWMVPCPYDWKARPLHSTAVEVWLSWCFGVTE